MIRLVDKLAATACGVVVAATAAVTCLAVFSRAVLGASLPWPEELTGHTLVWTSFLGAYLAAREDRHISFDLLVDALPERVARALRTVGDALVLAFFALLVWQSIRMISIVGGSELLTLPLPKGVFIAALPVCGVLVSIAIVARNIDRWKARP